MKNDGKDAEKAFVDYWQKSGGHVERLRDKRDLMGINGGRHVADFSKPSDFLVSRRDTPLHYAEVKSTNHKTLFEFKCIRDGQRVAATMEHQRGSGGYVFYIFSYETGAWYVMGCSEYVATVEAGKRSIPFKELTSWVK